MEGILWVLRTGARWRDLPAEYPSGVTCWRRLRRWEDEGVWLEAWQQLLAANHQRLLEWDETFLDGSFVSAKKSTAHNESSISQTLRKRSKLNHPVREQGRPGFRR